MYLDGSRQKIIAWVGEGLSDRIIAERLRVSPSTVRYWRERNGVVRPPKQKKTDEGTLLGSRSISSRIEFVAGDLFANAYAVEAFAHGCNCQGSMGAGIAVGFRERYPEMYEKYRELCKAQPRKFNLGDVWLWRAKVLPHVFNLGTQEGVWRSRASYEVIETSLVRMRELADAEGISSIAIPRIGVGYGGLSWKKVREIVERIFSEWTGRLVVYEDFVQTESKEEAMSRHTPG